MIDLQKKILVAEDDEFLRDMLVLVLKDEKYQVDAAENGMEAWALMSANKYDLLATDLYMPKMNGYELILKCQQSFPKTKIILFSGGGKEIEAEHGSEKFKFLDDEVKVNMFLKKPCNLNEILGSVENVLASED